MSKKKKKTKQKTSETQFQDFEGPRSFSGSAWLKGPKTHSSTHNSGGLPASNKGRNWILGEINYLDRA